jgi:hypothetical protein
MLGGIWMLRRWPLRLDRFLWLRNWGLRVLLRSRLLSTPSMDYDILLGTPVLVITQLRVRGADGDSVEE